MFHPPLAPQEVDVVLKVPRETLSVLRRTGEGGGDVLVVCCYCCCCWNVCQGCLRGGGGGDGSLSTTNSWLYGASETESGVERESEGVSQTSQHSLKVCV